MFGASIGRGAQRIIDAIVRWLAKGHISPNILTVIGVSLNVGCGLLLGRAISSGPESPSSSPTFSTCWTGKWPVCRAGSAIWRFSRLLAGPALGYGCVCGPYGLLCRDTAAHSTLNVFLAGAGLMGSVMVSYASARAESLIPKCDVGFLRRPERVVLFIIGALSTHPGSNNFFANRMPAVLWYSQLALIGPSRIACITWRELAKVEAEKTENVPNQEIRIQNPISFVKSAFPEETVTRCAF